MANAVNYFVRASDSAEVSLNKLVLANRVELAEDGTTTVSDTTATLPSLGTSAWGLIRATAATVVASLTSINPITLASETLTPTLASGQQLRGFFTAITLTSGSVVCHNIESPESAPVPTLYNVSVTPTVADDKKLDYNFSIKVGSGGHAATSTQIWRKVDSAAYALLHTTSDDNGKFTYNDVGVQTGATEVIKYKARYVNEAGQLGSYSSEITPLPDLPVLTLNTGTWTHSTLTAAFHVAIPAGALAADYFEVWGFADATAVVAAGALTLLATIHPAADGATTYNYSKAYAGLDDSADTIPVKFQVRYKTAASTPVYGLRSAVLSITTTDA